jgi:hypothetical protein
VPQAELCTDYGFTVNFTHKLLHGPLKMAHMCQIMCGENWRCNVWTDCAFVGINKCDQNVNKKKRSIYAHRCCNFGGQKWDKWINWEGSKVLRPYNRNTVHVEWGNKNVIPVLTGNWNHLRIIQKIPEQHTRKAWNPGTPENSRIRYSTHTSESTNVEVQKI